MRVVSPHCVPVRASTSAWSRFHRPRLLSSSSAREVNTRVLRACVRKQPRLVHTHLHARASYQISIQTVGPECRAPRRTMRTAAVAVAQCAIKPSVRLSIYLFTLHSTEVAAARAVPCMPAYLLMLDSIVRYTRTLAAVEHELDIAAARLYSHRVIISSRGGVVVIILPARAHRRTNAHDVAKLSLSSGRVVAALLAFLYLTCLLVCVCVRSSLSLPVTN